MSHNNIFWISRKKFVSKIAYSPGPSFKNVKIDILYAKVA
jgi:hypothetical protein